MKAGKPVAWLPIVGAFAIWFVHFMVSWAASEIWAHERTANGVAWAATALALLAMAAHALYIRARRAAGALAEWHCHLALGAVALATVAMLFSALPSLLLWP